MPKWKDLKRYCENTNWELYKVTDHYFYRKIMPNGDIYRTKVTKGSSEIGSGLWREILHHQLHTTQEEFNKNI